MNKTELKQLFYNRQRDLLWIANSSVGKKLLNNELDIKIIQLFPHGYRFNYEPKRYIDRFFTYERVAEKFLPILQKLDLYLETVGKLEKPYEALLNYSGFERKNKYPSFYLFTNSFTASGTGSIRLYVQNADYATARNAASGTADATSTRPSNSKIGGAGDYFIARAGASFYTANLPENIDIRLSANTFIRCLGDGVAIANNDTDSLSAVASTPADPANYVGADYDQFGTTKLTSDLAFASYNSTDGAANTLPLVSAGIPNISTTSWSNFGWRTSKEIAGTQPTNDNYVGMQDDTNLLSIDYEVDEGGVFLLS